MVDEKMKEEFLIWIRKAEGDLRKVKILMDGGEFDGALFYSQQVAEKALKGKCILRGLGLVKTPELGSLCRRLGAPNEVLNNALFLNPFERVSRYPDREEDLLDEKTAKRALVCAREVLKWCKQ